MASPSDLPSRILAATLRYAEWRVAFPDPSDSPSAQAKVELEATIAEVAKLVSDLEEAQRELAELRSQ